MMMIRRVCLLLLAVALLIILGFSTDKVKGFREELPPELVRAEALMVDPALLKSVSGEFKGLLADYLLLKVAVFLGGDEKATSTDWESLYLLLKQAMALDPYFYQNTYLIQGNLVWKKDMAGKAIELLKMQSEYRYWDWEPDWFIGFNYLHFFHDNSKALHHLEKASKIPGAAPIAGLIAARIARGQGNTLTAISMLKTMAEATNKEDFKKILEKRLEAYIGQYKIEQGIERYRSRFGRRPAVLIELVSRGILEALPKTPSGKDYQYNPESGEVFFDQTGAFK